jgi:hypothetical protein
MEKNEISSWRDWNRALPKFDFASADPEKLNAADIIGQLITGNIPKVPYRRNFQRCAFRESTGSGLEWPGVDYKDTVFVDAVFLDSMLGDCSTVSCTFTNCRFERCSFEGAAIHDTTYLNCTFVEADFRHSMFRNSRISSSQFLRCTTSNKLFDGCQLGQNTFDGTLLDFRAIVDNFGLDKGQLDPSLVREDRTHPHDQLFDFVLQSQNPDWVTSLSSFDRLKIQYYLDGGEMHGSEAMDSVFDAAEWLGAVRAPVNLMRLLQDFSDFLLHLYADNKLPVVFVVKMAQLAHALWTGFSANSPYSQLGNAAAGTYFACLRWLEDLDAAIADALLESTEQLRLRSFDEASDDEIHSVAAALRALIPGGEIRVTPRNSPMDIVLSHITPENVSFFVTLFFCTKTRLELSQRRNEDARENGLVPATLLKVDLGGAKGKLRNALTIQSALPGSLFIRLDVNYSSALIDKIRRSIKDLL